MNYAYDNLSKRQKVYVDAVIEHAPALGIDLNKDEFSRAELRQVSMTLKGKKWIPNWITHDQSRRAERGVFLIPEIKDAITESPSAVTPGEETDGDMEQDAVEHVVSRILDDAVDEMAASIDTEQEFSLL